MSLYPHIQALVHRKEENFPVGSLLFPSNAREPLLNFYLFARYNDNIADNTSYHSHDQEAWLLGMVRGLKTGDYSKLPEIVHPYYRDVQAGLSNPQHGIDLLTAFLLDVRQSRYPTFDVLIDYCMKSAVPVGRVVLELCKEPAPNYNAADSLCIALQLLNHIQDCKQDYLKLHRIYLPKEWFQAFGVTEQELAREECSVPLRWLFDEYMHHTRIYLIAAAELPKSIRNKRLRLELALTLELAWRLAKQLDYSDPISGKVRVPKWRWPSALFSALRRV